MADRTEKDLHGTHDDRSASQAYRRTGRARLLAAAILTMALVGALVPLSALGASGSSAVTILQTATATRGTATAVGTVARTATVAPAAGTVARTATVAPAAGTAVRTATAVATGTGGQPATVTRTVAVTRTATAQTGTGGQPATVTRTVAVTRTATAAVPAAPRAGGGGLVQGAGLAWPLAVGLVLLIAAGAAFAGYRRRVS